MSSAASAAATAEHHSPPRKRRGRPALSRRSALQLLAGLLLAAGIPVVATVRILDANAYRNERAHAEAALRVELQSANDELRALADDVATRADDLSRSHVLQTAFLENDVATINRLARRHPGDLFYLHGRRVAGRKPPVAIARSTALLLNGAPVGRVVATLPLDPALAARLLRAAPHARGDRLLIARAGVALGSGSPVSVEGRTVHIAGRAYRGLFSPVPNTPHASLLAVRPESTIRAAVQPYRERVLYAALGSVSLLVLVGLLLGGPILRGLGDFRRVASQATTDSLTGLANRWAFDEELALEWRRAERVGDPLALILADLDNFKSINDTYGHQVGDQVLRTVGEVLAASVRQVDLAARHGGEEFAVIVPEADLGRALTLAGRLRTALEKTEIVLPDGNEIRVTASFGVAVKDDLPRAEELVAKADEALYEAKRSGKNRVAPERPTRARKTKAEPAERRRRRPAD
jgi:diguanylate cyclase (GGDEF)-like protein